MNPEQAIGFLILGCYLFIGLAVAIRLRVKAGRRMPLSYWLMNTMMGPFIIILWVMDRRL